MTDERLSEIERYWVSNSDHARVIRELAAEVRRLREENANLREGRLDEGEMM